MPPRSPYFFSKDSDGYRVAAANSHTATVKPMVRVSRRPVANKAHAALEMPSCLQQNDMLWHATSVWFGTGFLENIACLPPSSGSNQLGTPGRPMCWPGCQGCCLSALPIEHETLYQPCSGLFLLRISLIVLLYCRDEHLVTKKNHSKIDDLVPDLQTCSRSNYKNILRSRMGDGYTGARP
ncbi:hypothetical protein MGYG_03326 [Nannizzia gypsea CBS 118893]|uniref:Uncharacterized protein n=1 Tax=Arthroderma gypseum (strain ATCC MYA-4604 / CBS 118893) TaxID=535722 RepID=E4UN22_ARTGP|nr:hypothetical protein MGYG_03326 [Nannizzia gypsea CBS 118893]EFR00324.1 hypothetical protein MGYG_03326 [Nannizzia gypsea CBS 118893]